MSHRNEKGKVMKDGLTREQVDAINSMMHDFRYNYEGARDTDSIEEWVDKWIENQAV